MRARGSQRQVPAAFGVLAGAVLATFMTTVPALSAGAHTVSRRYPRYYVAIGASESLGMQPVPGSRRSMRTDDGYANDLLSMERRRWMQLRLVQFGCPGITVQGSLDGKSACHYPDGSEVATAVHFIEAHRARVRLVTVDLGFNDLLPCLSTGRIRHVCVAEEMTAISRDLPVITRRIKSAAGLGALVVGIEHDDPYLASARHGAWRFALASAAALEQMNRELGSVYRKAGTPVARVPDSTIADTVDRGRYTISGVGPNGRRRVREPEWAQDPSFRHELVQVCSATWMCSRGNIHPTDAGYREIASAISRTIARAEIRAPTAPATFSRGRHYAGTTFVQPARRMGSPRPQYRRALPVHPRSGSPP
ncbi:MAG: hypothetical protein ACRDV8_13140 [Acidimicrobiales bacterium]